MSIRRTQKAIDLELEAIRWWGAHAVLTEDRYPCPILDCPHVQKMMISLVAHLNDQHVWTFNQIADWLDSTGSEIVL